MKNCLKLNSNNVAKYETENSNNPKKLKIDTIDPPDHIWIAILMLKFKSVKKIINKLKIKELKIINKNIPKINLIYLFL